LELDVIHTDPARATPQAHDEHRDATGTVRPHQRLLQEFLAVQSGEAVTGLQRAIRGRMSEQEVTFNILGVPQGNNRPWQLDPVPLVLDHTEYSALGAGLCQRARLLELILADLYGPQRLLKSGQLPARVVLENPRFWRACHGWTGSRLQLYAADLARDAHGNYFVYSDRTAAPAGAGYALENRLVLGRTLPELFQRYSVLKLNRFFQALHRSIQGLARTSRDQPRIVVLTPGMQDESSFEHAYLSRYLGYDLVEGRDLTVREGTVYMKTISGLKPVDVVLRRVFDDYCDPLELRADSMSGVPGLVSAARAGGVVLANPLGSALVESPLFKAYLPRLCRELLGEDLKLPSVPTWWCGDPLALFYVLQNIEQLVIKPAFADRRGEPIVAQNLSRAEREALVKRIQARPWQFVAEQWSPAWLAPFFSNGVLSNGQVAMRTFLCSQDDGFEVMMGGLARIDSAPDGIFLSLSTDRVIKDVWVPSPTPVADLPLPAMPEQRLQLRRGGVELPSRLLDDIYWLGRYVERADNTARLLRAGIERLSYDTATEPTPGLEAIIDALVLLEVLPKSGSGARVPANETTLRSVLKGAGGNDLRSTLQRVHELTLRARTRLSRDAWHVLHRLKWSLDEIDDDNALTGPDRVIELLDTLLIRLAAVSGTVLDTMVRGHSWMFLDMGRKLERSVFVLALLGTFLPKAATRVHFEALLEVSDSLLTYRARYLSSLQTAPVVDLLLTDETNPHSLRYQVDAIVSHFAGLPQESDAQRSQAERRMIRLQAELMTFDVMQACAGDAEPLHLVVRDWVASLFQFSDELAQRFFSHVETSHALAPATWLSDETEMK
jgi:uncharacterized circularly permuted ATP-grasp superfamily protein/uncharacterized alpha-E superfamily protein